MEIRDNRLVFECGDELKVHIPKPFDSDMRVRAIPAKSDSYFCYDCCFFGVCRQYKGGSPLSLHCNNTIFQVVE